MNINIKSMVGSDVYQVNDNSPCVVVLFGVRSDVDNDCVVVSVVGAALVTRMERKCWC